MSCRELSADKALIQEIVSDGCNGRSDEVNFLEHVEINITLSYTNRGALNISIISPDGGSWVFLFIIQLLWNNEFVIWILCSMICDVWLTTKDIQIQIDGISF